MFSRHRSALGLRPLFALAPALPLLAKDTSSHSDLAPPAPGPSRSAGATRLSPANARFRGVRAAAYAVTALGLGLVACSAAPEDATSSSNALSLPSPPIGLPGPPRTVVGWNAAWADTGMADIAAATPLATTWGANRIDLFLRNGTGLTQRTFNGSSWAPAAGTSWPLAVKDGLASDPAGVGWGGGNVDWVWRDANNSLEHMYWNSSGVWTEESLTGTFSGRPTIAIAPDGSRGDVFVRVGTDVWHRGWGYVVNNWSGWERLALEVTDDPVAVTDAPGKIAIFYRGTDGKTNWASWDGTLNGTQHQAQLAGAAWTAHPNIDGYLEGAASVVSPGPGVYQVSGVGGDGGVWINQSADGGATWTNWSELDGCTRTTQIAAASWGQGREDIFAVSNDTGEIMQKTYSANPSLTPGAHPVCCNHDGQQVTLVNDDPSTVTMSFTNDEATTMTLVAQNETVPSDHQTVTIAAGQGVVSHAFTGLQPGGTYYFTASTGGAQTVCGYTSWNEITLEPATETFSISGSAPAANGQMAYSGQVVVSYTGEVTWSVHVNHQGSYDVDYVIDVSFPNVAYVGLALNGKIGVDTNTDPYTVPLTDARSTAAIRAAYLQLKGQTSLPSEIIPTVLYPEGVSGGGSACPNGGPAHEVDVCCDVAGQNVEAGLVVGVQRHAGARCGVQSDWALFWLPVHGR